MRRALALLGFLTHILREVIIGSLRVSLSTIRPRSGQHLCIVAFPLKARTDLEVTVLAAAVTITPGTLIVGTAAGTPDEPPVLYVHSIFGTPDELMAVLRDLERRWLAVTREGTS